jgi:acetoin utilization protein AcuB
MTPGPWIIARDRSLASARRMMLDNNIRHLPVVEKDQVVGILSERDLLLVEALPGVNPTDVRVDEAMVEDPFAVSADAPLADVAETLVERKIGSAVVVEGDRVIGVFTTIDAVRALSDLLSS